MTNKRQWLIALREQQKLTQLEVTKKAGLPRSTYAQYEVGRRTPTVKNAQKVAQVLGFDWTIFFVPDGCLKHQKDIA